MNKPSPSTSNYLTLALIAGLVVAAASSQAQSATATISETTGTGGNFDYTIVLKNTGTQSLNSFWYGWTTSGNNLPSDPTAAANSLGWTGNDLDSNSIQYQNTGGTGMSLAAGQSATFTFDSTSTLAQITAGESGASVAFTTDGIQFNQGVAGQSTGVFSPTIASVPEPSSMALMAGGLLVMAGSIRKLASRKSRPTA
jgi:hypothetical protein